MAAISIPGIKSHEATEQEAAQRLFHSLKEIYSIDLTKGLGDRNKSLSIGSIAVDSEAFTASGTTLSIIIPAENENRPRMLTAGVLFAALFYTLSK